MQLDRNVGDIAVHVAGAIAVFERHQIDFCCGGQRSLREACERAGLDPDAILAELTTDDVVERDWSTAPIGELLDHILQTHHEYLRAEVPGLTALADKVARRHGEEYPFLVELNRTSRALFAELDTHLMKEEQVLFPMIRAKAAGQATPMPVSMPIQVMEQEHDAAGEMLAAIRKLTSGFRPPAAACTSWRALYTGLERLEADLHVHIHLENNVLHPRANALR